jgi:hypothetical protein
MVAERLFGGGQWLADPETCAAIGSVLIRLGLEEEVSDRPGTRRNTPLGNELHLELMFVFLGYWSEPDAIMVLNDYGLITDAEAEDLLHIVSEEDIRHRLHRYAQRAYRDYFNPSGFKS